MELRINRVWINRAWPVMLNNTLATSWHHVLFTITHTPLHVINLTYQISYRESLDPCQISFCCVLVISFAVAVFPLWNNRSNIMMVVNNWSCLLRFHWWLVSLICRWASLKIFELYVSQSLWLTRIHNTISELFLSQLIASKPHTHQSHSLLDLLDFCYKIQNCIFCFYIS